MRDTVLFLSDIHLGCNPRFAITDREKHLHDLLNEKKESLSHLILLGDIFEFWMEYKHFIPKSNFSFLMLLKELSDSGVEVHYFAGNHDFNLGSFFEDSLGVIVHSDSALLKLQGRKVFLQHGDGLAHSDYKYRIVKWVIRHPINNFLFKLIHPDFGMKLAGFVGGASRDHNSYGSVPFNEYEDAAYQLLESNQADAFLHGHIHKAIHKKKPNGEYISTGQWLFAEVFTELKSGVFTQVILRK